MSAYDFAAPRLFLDAALAPQALIELTSDQCNYLLNVLRMAPGAGVLVFNGRDGEWRARLEIASRKRGALRVSIQTRPQTPVSNIHYVFAPIKHARLDYMVQKAVEMGAGRMTPVLTARTQLHRLNAERMRSNAIEAAEQCGILCLPQIDPPLTLAAFLSQWPGGQLIVFCDEDAPPADPAAALSAVREKAEGPVAVLIGPEGGFDEAERAAIRAKETVSVISLGPRILRADTAGVAAMALVQSALGDWRGC